jgi:hypothetical protein
MNENQYSKLVLNTIKKYKIYRTQWLESTNVQERAESILKANFVIGFFAYKLEYSGSKRNELVYNENFGNNNLNNAKSMNTNEKNRIDEMKKNDKSLGVNQFSESGNGNSIIIPVVNLLNSNYGDLEQKFILKIRSLTKTVRINKQSTDIEQLQQIFKQTQTPPTKNGNYPPKFLKMFFFHASGMFGWYSYIGYYKKRNGTIIKNRYTGSCNVYAILTAYLAMLYDKINQITYVAHGVPCENGSTNERTCQRKMASTINPKNIQLCHHGFRINKSNNAMLSVNGGIHAHYFASNIRSLSQIFDVLCLTQLYRLVFRLERQKNINAITALLSFYEFLFEFIDRNIMELIFKHSFKNANMLNKSYYIYTTNYKAPDSTFKPVFEIGSEYKRSFIHYFPKNTYTKMKNINSKVVEFNVPNLKKFLKYSKRKLENIKETEMTTNVKVRINKQNFKIISIKQQTN